MLPFPISVAHRWRDREHVSPWGILPTWVPLTYPLSSRNLQQQEWVEKPLSVLGLPAWMNVIFAEHGSVPSHHKGII